MATLSTVTGLARLLLDDVDADVFTDPILLGYVNAAYSDMWQRLNAYGVKQPVKTSPGIAVAAALSPSALTIPADVVVPMEMWEKGSAENDDQYISMSLVDDLRPDQATSIIGQWKWEGGAIIMRPADNDRIVKLQYESSQAQLVGPDDPVYPAYAENYIGFMTAAMAARSRDQRDFANDLAQFAASSLLQLIGNQVQGNQRNLKRPHKYGDKTR